MLVDVGIYEGAMVWTGKVIRVLKTNTLTRKHVKKHMLNQSPPKFVREPHALVFMSFDDTYLVPVRMLFSNRHYAERKAELSRMIARTARFPEIGTDGPDHVY